MLLYRLRTDPTENTAFIVGEACIQSRFLTKEVYSWCAEHIENTSTGLLTARVCWTVYRAVAWQRSNQNRYNMLQPVNSYSIISTVKEWRMEC
jgi:hypothetical protein